jgi:hypothetical protein
MIPLSYIEVKTVSAARCHCLREANGQSVGLILLNQFECRDICCNVLMLDYWKWNQQEAMRCPKKSSNTFITE